MHRMRRLPLALVLATALAGGAAGSWGQQAAEEPPAEEAFFDTVDVNVINVEVYVTEKDGTPLTDLTREDFEILEDGRPVTITNFYKVVEGAIPGEPAPVQADLPPGAPVEEAAPSVPDEQRLYLAVYVDNLNIRPFNRNRVFRRVREFLRDHVGPNDKVMLVTFERSFHERVAFTNDPTLINSALFDIEKESGQGVHDDSERRDVLEWIEEAESPTHALVRVRQYAGSKFNDLMFTIDALKEFVNKLGGLEGRKAVLYVSDGLPQVAADDLFYAVHQRYQDSSVLMEARDYDATRRFQELANQANANRVTFYTIDAAGLRPLTAASAETRSAGMSSYVDTQYIHNVQAPLLLLADETGGRAIINTNDVGPSLQEIGRELRTYYSLGYQPSHSGDGRFHRIQVRVARKGVEVRHREGYRDKTIEQRMGDGTTAAMIFGIESNPLGVKIGFGEPRRREEGHYLMPVRVAIPLRDVVLVPMGEKYEARLRVFVAAMDQEGGTSPVQEARLPISIPATEVDRAREMNWAYDMTLLMRRGYHNVAIGVRDELSGTQSFATATTNVEAR